MGRATSRAKERAKHYRAKLMHKQIKTIKIPKLKISFISKIPPGKKKPVSPRLREEADRLNNLNKRLSELKIAKGK